VAVVVTSTLAEYFTQGSSLLLRFLQRDGGQFWKAPLRV
jgi:hypothetical protein